MSNFGIFNNASDATSSSSSEVSDTDDYNYKEDIEKESNDFVCIFNLISYNEELLSLNYLPDENRKNFKKS